MKKIKYFFWIFLFFNLLYCKEITLQEGLEILHKNNLQLKILESRLIQAKYKKLESFSNFLPKLQIQAQFVNLSQPQMKIPPSMMGLLGSAFSYSMISQQYYNFSFNISQMVFSSGRNLSLYQISNLNYEFVKNEYEKTKKDLEIQYKEIFLKTLLAKKIVEVSNKALQISSENYKVSTELYKEGRVSYLDFASSKINYLNSEINLLKIKNNYEIAKDNLKNILCVDCEFEPIGELESFLKDFEYDVLNLKKNIRNVYEVKSVDLQKSILTKNLKITKTEVLPTISILGNYTWSVDDYTRDFDMWDDRYNWMVVLSWPIFNSGGTYSRYIQNKESINQTEIAKKNLISSLELYLDTLYSTYLQLKESLHLAKDNLDLAEENYKIAKSYYLEGRSSYLELLQAELNLSNTKISYYQTLTDYVVTVEKLKKFIVD